MRKQINKVFDTYERATQMINISKFAVDDENLSLEAKGLYLIIQRWLLHDEGHRIDRAFLETKANLEPEKFHRLWVELVVNGYLKEHRVPVNRFPYAVVYDLLDKPY